MEKKETIVEAEERTILEEDVKVREIYPDTSFEIDIPNSVLVTLDVCPGRDGVRFVEENDRIYLEKTNYERFIPRAEEKTIVSDKEEKTASKQDYYTDYEKSMKEKFEPGSVSIERIDHEWNMVLPDNLHYALGLSEGDHIRFEAVDRETFKISKIR